MQQLFTYVYITIYARVVLKNKFYDFEILITAVGFTSAKI